MPAALVAFPCETSTLVYRPSGEVDRHPSAYPEIEPNELNVESSLRHVCNAAL